MLIDALSTDALTRAAAGARPAIRLQSFMYREQSSHGFTVEGFQAALDVDPTRFWLACFEALDEREMVEDADDLRALIARCRPRAIDRSALAQTIEAVCRGHLAQARRAMGEVEAGARLTLAWNIDAVYARTAQGQYGFFWHTSE